MTQPTPGAAESLSPQRRIAELEARLQEAEETLEAIRNGEVDAVIVGGLDDRQVYTLESADRPYRVLVEQMREGAVTLSPEGTVLYANQCFAGLLRVPLERVIGSSVFQFIADAEREAFGRLLASSAAGGGRGEFGLRASDGSTVSAHLSYIDLPNEDERILCGIVTDITEQRRLEDQLRQAQKMEAVGQLTGGLAHDFNNLLTVILGNLERARPRVADEAVARQIDHARQAAERGARLTQQLLAFSRRQSLQPQVVCVNALLPELGPLIERGVGEGIELGLIAGDALWHCRTDPNQFESAILNLAINARDAMPQGGRLTIESANAILSAADAAAMRDASPGRYVKVSVVDTGEGMTADILARVFEPFFTTKEVGKGSGLGLSMVYGFARQSNGHVSIDSAPGRGTAIHLYLPFAERPAAQAARPLAPPQAGPGRATILVVEDDPYVRALAVALVEDLGHEVLEAENAAGALALLDRRPDVELLFTDIVMPQAMSGIDLAREARRRRPDLAVLLTSGFTTQSLAQGPDGGEEFRIVHKPYRHQQLVEAIGAALREARDRRAAAGTATNARGTKGLRVLVVEDEALISMVLEDILADLDCEVVGPVAQLAKALEAARSDRFDIALVDVNLGRDKAYPVADTLAERGIPYAFMTGHDSASLPEPYRRLVNLAKPYTAGDVEEVVTALAAGA